MSTIDDEGEDEWEVKEYTSASGDERTTHRENDNLMFTPRMTL